MAPASLDDLQAFARRTAGGRHDDFSSEALSRAVTEYAGGRREVLAPFRVTVDGREYSSVLTALADPGTTFDTAELRLVDPPAPGPTWDWLAPISRITFYGDGSAEVAPLDKPGTQERAIARLLLREHYIPRSREDVAHSGPAAASGGLPSQLESLKDSVAFARKHGVVVFATAVLLYFANYRVRFELDLLNDTLLRDPRAGRWPVTRRVHRTSRIAHAVDAFLARGELPVYSARALEFLVETHGVTPLEITPVLGGVREYGASALQGLAARGLATFDRRTGVYRPRFDAFLGAEPGDAAPRAPLPNPALRTSVMELLAAADSRATCPLCGDALPPGPRRLLCDRCAAEVGTGVT